MGKGEGRRISQYISTDTYNTIILKEKQEKELAIKREKEEKERIEREEQERTDRILEGIGTVIGLVGSLLDL